MKKIIPGSLLAILALVVIGLIGFQIPTVSASDDAAKREEDTVEVADVEDEDDDDTADRSRTNTQATGVDTQASRDVSRDVSRDNSRDVSRDNSHDNTN